MKQMIMGTWKYNRPNLWNAANAVLGGMFIAINAYSKKDEGSQINNLILHFKELEKEDNPKVI